MKNAVKITTIALMLAFAAAGSAMAELEWETDHVSMKAELGQEKVIAKFPFKNVSEDTAVKISQVRASCGCTTTKLEKDNYEPGETGDIEAVFTLGGRQGKQIKKIFVHLDNQTTPTYTLTLEVDIPELLKIEPRFVYWSASDELKEKVIEITVPHEGKVFVRQVRCMNNQLEVDLKTIEDGKKYEVVVTPQDLEKSMYSAIYIDAVLPDGQNKTFTASARIAGKTPYQPPTRYPKGHQHTQQNPSNSTDKPEQGNHQASDSDHTGDQPGKNEQTGEEKSSSADPEPQPQPEPANTGTTE